MQLVAWLGACGALVITCGTRRQYVVIYTAVGLFIFLPWIASDLITGVSPIAGGANLSLHPAAWLVLIAAIIRISSEPADFLFLLSRHKGPFLTITAYILLATLLTALSGSSRGMLSLLYLLILPFLALLLVHRAAMVVPDFSTRLGKVFVAFAAGQGLIAVVQGISARTLFYETSYSRYYWWSESFSRALGTTDHPLMLSLLLCSALPLTVLFHNIWLRVGLPILFLCGVYLTGSRAGIVAAALASVWVVLVGRGRPAVKVLLSVALVATGGFILLGGPGSGALARFSDDSGSTRVRLRAYELFLEHLSEYWIIGGGSASSYDLLARASLNSSFESTALTFAVDFGLLPTVAYYCALVALIMGRRHRARAALAARRLGAMTAFILLQSYSGGTLQSSATFLVLVLIAIASAPSERLSARPRPTPSVGISR